MEIVSGKFYNTRSGVKVGPIYHDGKAGWYWKAPQPASEKWDDMDVPAWWKDGLFYKDEEHPNDLVSEWKDQPPIGTILYMNITGRDAPIGSPARLTGFDDPYLVVEWIDRELHNNHGQSNGRYFPNIFRIAPEPLHLAVWTPEQDGVGDIIVPLIRDPAVEAIEYLTVPEEKLMNVFIALKETSQTIEHEDVKNTYTKGPFYCVYTSQDQVIKYPIDNIWRVTEDYSK